MNLVSILFSLIFPLLQILHPQIEKQIIEQPSIRQQELLAPVSEIFPASIKWQIKLNSFISFSAIDENTLYLFTDDSNILLVSLADGKYITLNDERFSNIKLAYFHKELLYFLTKNSLFTFNKNNYEIKKVMDFDSEIRQAYIDGSKLAIIFDKAIGIFDIENQAYKSIVLNENFSFLALYFYKEKIIGINKDGIIISFASSGKTLRRLDIKKKVYSAGAIYGNILYQPINIYLYAIDLDNLSIKWKTLLGAKSYFPPLIDSDRIFIAPINNLLYCLSKKGNRKWVKLLKFRISANLLSIKDEVIVFPYSSDIISFSKKDGRQLASHNSQINQPILKSYYVAQKLILQFPEAILSLEKALPPAVVPSTSEQKESEQAGIKK